MSNTVKKKIYQTHIKHFITQVKYTLFSIAHRIFYRIAHISGNE